MPDAPEDEVTAARVPLDHQSLPQGIPLVLQVPPLHGGSDPNEFFYNPFVDVKPGNFAAACAFFVHHGHIVVFHDCPNAMAFQNLYPLATTAYISLLPKGLIAKGYSLLKAQCAALFCPSPHLSVRVLAPPCSLLDSYIAAGLAGARVGPPLALVHSNTSASASGNGLIQSPSIPSQGFKSSTAVTSCSSTAVASVIPPKQHPQSSSWRPDPDGYDVSSRNNYRGHHLAYGGSYPCYVGSGMPANWHSSSQIKSCVGCPSHQYGGPSFHPQDVPPFIFPQDRAPIASGFVLRATASMASSLGGTVVPLSSLCHVDVPSLLDSDLTMSFAQARAFRGHFGMAPSPGYRHLPAIPTPTIPRGVLVTHEGFLVWWIVFLGVLPYIAQVLVKKMARYST